VSQVRPCFGALIIGDELLTGKRQDKHLGKLIEMLGERGLELSWARIVGDDPPLLTQTLRETLASGAEVFSFGGIGATPDDRTRSCAGAAFGLPMAVHPEGRRMLEQRFGPELPPSRLRLVEFPEGAGLIPNPVNQVPGFSVRGHHFVPGFPSMAWPMVSWVLDTHYAALHAPGSVAERGITVFKARESDVMALLEAIEAGYPSLRLSCLPDSQGGRQLELALRGAPATVTEGLAELCRGIDALGFTWQPLPPR
jgi:molybdopterin-biosynthesis enzyme MoeA-like protein